MAGKEEETPVGPTRTPEVGSHVGVEGLPSRTLIGRQDLVRSVTDPSWQGYMSGRSALRRPIQWLASEYSAWGLITKGQNLPRSVVLPANNETFTKYTTVSYWETFRVEIQANNPRPDFYVAAFQLYIDWVANARNPLMLPDMPKLWKMVVNSKGLRDKYEGQMQTGNANKIYPLWRNLIRVPPSKTCTVMVNGQEIKYSCLIYPEVRKTDTGIALVYHDGDGKPRNVGSLTVPRTTVERSMYEPDKRVGASMETMYHDIATRAPVNQAYSQVAQSVLDGLTALSESFREIALEYVRADPPIPAAMFRRRLGWIVTKGGLIPGFMGKAFPNGEPFNFVRGAIATDRAFYNTHMSAKNSKAIMQFFTRYFPLRNYTDQIEELLVAPPTLQDLAPPNLGEEPKLWQAIMKQFDLTKGAGLPWGGKLADKYWEHCAAAVEMMQEMHRIVDDPEYQQTRKQEFWSKFNIFLLVKAVGKLEVYKQSKWYGRARDIYNNSKANLIAFAGLATPMNAAMVHATHNMTDIIKSLESYQVSGAMYTGPDSRSLVGSSYRDMLPLFWLLYARKVSGHAPDAFYYMSDNLFVVEETLNDFIWISLDQMQAEASITKMKNHLMMSYGWTSIYKGTNQRVLEVAELMIALQDEFFEKCRVVKGSIQYPIESEVSGNITTTFDNQAGPLSLLYLCVYTEDGSTVQYDSDGFAIRPENNVLAQGVKSDAFAKACRTSGSLFEYENSVSFGKILRSLENPELGDVLEFEGCDFLGHSLFVIPRVAFTSIIMKEGVIYGFTGEVLRQYIQSKVAIYDEAHRRMHATLSFLTPYSEMMHVMMFGLQSSRQKRSLLWDARAEFVRTQKPGRRPSPQEMMEEGEEKAMYWESLLQKLLSLSISGSMLDTGQAATIIQMWKTANLSAPPAALQGDIPLETGEILSISTPPSASLMFEVYFKITSVKFTKTLHDRLFGVKLMPGEGIFDEPLEVVVDIPLSREATVLPAPDGLLKDYVKQAYGAPLRETDQPAARLGEALIALVRKGLVKPESVRMLGETGAPPVPVMMGYVLIDDLEGADSSTVFGPESAKLFEKRLDILVDAGVLTLEEGEQIRNNVLAERKALAVARSISTALKDILAKELLEREVLIRTGKQLRKLEKRKRKRGLKPGQVPATKEDEGPSTSGPKTISAEQARLLSSVKGMGFDEARLEAATKLLRELNLPVKVVNLGAYNYAVGLRGRLKAAGITVPLITLLAAAVAFKKGTLSSEELGKLADFPVEKLRENPPEGQFVLLSEFLESHAEATTAKGGDRK